MKKRKKGKVKNREKDEEVNEQRGKWGKGDLGPHKVLKAFILTRENHYRKSFLDPPNDSCEKEGTLHLSCLLCDASTQDVTN